jgi:hypothetical protein
VPPSTNAQAEQPAFPFKLCGPCLTPEGRPRPSSQRLGVYSGPSSGSSRLRSRRLAFAFGWAHGVSASTMSGLDVLSCPTLCGLA